MAGRQGPKAKTKQNRNMEHSRHFAQKDDELRYVSVQNSGGWSGIIDENVILVTFWYFHLNKGGVLMK